MKKILLLLLGVSCSHMKLEQPLLRDSKLSMQTHLATPEELSRSMQLAHFTEYDKDNKKTDLFFATYEPSGLNADNSFYEFGPSIIIKRGDKSPAEFLSWPELTKFGWVSAAQLPSKGYYWGFLDYQVEGLGSEVLIFWSRDSGKTWSQLSSLKKKAFSDEFYAFTVDELGSGTATIKRYGEGIDGTEGFDVYLTNDFGQSWSAPVFYKSVFNFVNTFGSKCSFSMKPTKRIPKDCALSLEKI